MVIHDRSADRGARAGRRQVKGLGEQFRIGRVAADLTQGSVAKALGWSYMKVGRFERGDSPNVALVDICQALAVVGLGLSARAYPLGSPLRDRAHLALLERFRGLLSPTLMWATEVPLPNAGDLRAWDGLIRGPTFRIGVECETRVADWQELDRRTTLKRRDGAVDHVILLLADTRNNRAFMRDHAQAIATAFPVSGRAALAALAAGREPLGSAVILL